MTTRDIELVLTAEGIVNCQPEFAQKQYSSAYEDKRDYILEVLRVYKLLKRKGNESRRTSNMRLDNN